MQLYNRLSYTIELKYKWSPVVKTILNLIELSGFHLNFCEYE